MLKRLQSFPSLFAPEVENEAAELNILEESKDETSSVKLLRITKELTPNEDDSDEIKAELSKEREKFLSILIEKAENEHCFDFAIYMYNYINFLATASEGDDYKQSLRYLTAMCNLSLKEGALLKANIGAHHISQACETIQPILEGLGLLSANDYFTSLEASIYNFIHKDSDSKSIKGAMAHARRGDALKKLYTRMLRSIKIDEGITKDEFQQINSVLKQVFHKGFSEILADNRIKVMITEAEQEREQIESNNKLCLIM